MSYALELFRPPLDADVLTAGRDSFRQSCQCGDPGPVDSNTERLKHALAAALVRFEPNLKSFQIDFATYAKEEGTDVAEARRRHRQVYVKGRGPLQGVLLTLQDQAVCVSVSYLDGSVESLARLWALLQFLQDEAGFRAYDPQVDQVLNLRTDFERVRHQFVQQSQKLSHLITLGGLT